MQPIQHFPEPLQAAYASQCRENILAPSSIWFGKSTIIKIALVIFSALLILPFVARRAWVLHKAKVALLDQAQPLETSSDSICKQRLEQAKKILEASWTTKHEASMIKIQQAKHHLSMSQLQTVLDTLSSFSSKEAKKLQAVAYWILAKESNNSKDRHLNFQRAKFLMKEIDDEIPFARSNDLKQPNNLLSDCELELLRSPVQEAEVRYDTREERRAQLWRSPREMRP